MKETTDLIGILLALLFQVSIAVLCFILFSILRPLNLLVYEPRTVYAEKKPEKLNSNLFAWIRPIITFRELNSAQEIGLDAIMFLRFVALGFKFFAIATITSIPLMLIHIYAQNIAKMDFVGLDHKLVNPSLALLSVTHVPKGSLVFYFHAFFAYGYTLLAFYLLHQVWSEYITLRQDYFASTAYTSQDHNKTLLFTYIPEEMKSNEMIKESIAHLEFQPTRIFFGRDYMSLPKWIEQHRQATAEFEKLIHNYYTNPSNIPLTRPKKGSLCFGKQVDAIEYYKGLLHALERRIYQARSRSDTTFRPDSSCFVQYESIHAAHVAANELYLEKTWKEPKVGLSPDFEDIEWDNIGLSKSQKGTRKIYSFFVMVGITILWILFSVFIGLLSQITLWRNINEEFAEKIASSQAWIIFIQSFLSPTIMALANWVLPSILKKVAYLEGFLSRSGISKSAMSKYFVLQFYLMLSHIGTSFLDPLIISLSSGSVTNAFQTFIRQLLNQFVAVGTFYINYTITGYTFFGIEILQGVSLFFYMYSRLLGRHTPREQYRRNAAPCAQYVTLYGFLLMSFLLGISYSLISPLIIPFTAISFGIAYVAMKYQLLYVYDAEIDSGGTWWPKVFNLLCFSILIFQLMTFGSIFVVGFQNSFQTVNHGLIPNILLMVLPLFTIAFWIYISRNVAPRGDYMEKRDYAQVSTSADIPKQDHFDRVFNPAVSKPLRKVWVRPELAFFLESIYQPEFQNTVDFVRKSDPERTIAIEKQQQMRTGRIKTLLKKDVQRHRRKTLADLVFVAREQQLDPELPPELPLLDETMFPRSASPTRSTAESPTKDL